MALAKKQVELLETREALTSRVQELVSEGYKVREFSEDSVYLTYHSLGKPVPHVLWALFTVLIGNVFYALLSYASTRREIWVRVGEV
ncbi:MAG: hypothetical protein V3S26_06865 [Acidimicrobiia bacterium]